LFSQKEGFLALRVLMLSKEASLILLRVCSRRDYSGLLLQIEDCLMKVEVLSNLQEVEKASYPQE
jgi:hypothetical protein